MTTWVLLRGLMREARHWGKFPGQFQNAMDAQHVVSLDFPGNGSLYALTSPVSVAELVDFSRAQLAKLGYPPPYRVLALSMGAMVAVAWSERYPDELDRLVLINTSMAPYNPFYQRLRPENYIALSRLLFGTEDQRERLILKLTSNLINDSEHKQTILQQWTGYAREYPVTRANILRQLCAAARFHAAPSAPPVSALLLTGQQDRLVNANCSLTLAQHWHCAISLHPTAGHDLPLDDGDWVTQQVREWLDP